MPNLLLAVATSIEEPADVAHSKTISRDHFELNYPGNGMLARGNEQFDIEEYFNIDTPGQSYVLLKIYRVDTSRQDNVRDSIEYFTKGVRVSDKTSFNTWGEFTGVGVQLVGDYVGEPCVVRIFSHTTGDVSFTVTEFFNTATKQHVQLGLELVEATFKLGSLEDDE